MITVVRTEYREITKLYRDFTENLEILPSSVNAYEIALDDEIDYVGTRLHAGIFAMRHGVRSIILTVDDRMAAMEECISANCVQRGDLDKLREMICGEVITSTELDWKAISKWKEQFS